MKKIATTEAAIHQNRESYRDVCTRRECVLAIYWDFRLACDVCASTIAYRYGDYKKIEELEGILSDNEVLRVCYGVSCGH